MWLVVGDKAVVKDKIKELGLEMHEIDVDGNIIDQEITTPKKEETPKN